VIFDRGDDRCRVVIETAIEIARSSGGELTPLHLLVALSEDDAVALLLDTPVDLRAAVFGDLGPPGPNWHAGYWTFQPLNSAKEWAGDEQRFTPEHLVVALIEQADPDVVAARVKAGIDLNQVRQRVLIALGWDEANVPPLATMPPAGTAGRPPLPLSELPADVWAELVDRQQRLPFERMRRTWQWYGLHHKEFRAVRRIADRRHLSNDERYSFLHYHRKEVERLGAEKIPRVVAAADEADEQRPRGEWLTVRFGNRTRRWSSPLPSGWLTWFGNRRAGIRDAWFRLTWHY